MKDSINLFKREGKNIYIKTPAFEELEYVSFLWQDKETMNGIGGVFKFAKEKWESFYKKMINPTDGKNFYCLVYLKNGQPVGEVSFHGFDTITKVARFNIKIEAKYRGNGYGSEACLLLLEYYFNEVNGEYIVDNLPTNESEGFVNKLNFNTITMKNGDKSVRISKKDFLERAQVPCKNVLFILNNNEELLDYVVAKKILLLANKISHENLFNIFVNTNEEILGTEGITFSSMDKVYTESDKIHILYEKNGNNIRCSYDYLCLKTDEKIVFRDLGMKLQYGNFNGVMITTLNLIGKIYGKSLKDKVSRELGVITTL